MHAIELISDSVLPVSPDKEGEFALKMMEAFKLSDVPVVKDDDFRGLLTEKIVYDFNKPGSIIEDFGRLPDIFVYEDQHCFDVLQVMSVSKSTSVAVLSREKKYLGAITIHEIIPELSALFSMHQPGGVIVLGISSKDYTLSEISQIVESNGASIVSLYVTPKKGDYLEITTRINRNDLTSIIHTFERYEYEVLEYYTESNDLDDFFDERYQSLMKYLNV